MGKLDFANEEQEKEFQEKLQSLAKFLNEQEDHTYYNTLAIIMNDNIKMFNRIQELENGTEFKPETEQ